jgi:hypothetical protein
VPDELLRISQAGEQGYRSLLQLDLKIFFPDLVMGCQLRNRAGKRHAALFHDYFFIFWQDL